MGYLSQIIDRIKQKIISEEIGHAIVILSSWVTAADGVIHENEISETEKFIDEFELFQKLNRNSLKKSYRSWAERFVKNPGETIVDGLKGIFIIKDHPEALPLMQLAVRIARADGDFSEKEKAVIERACRYLEIKPDDVLRESDTE